MSGVRIPPGPFLIKKHFFYRINQKNLWIIFYQDDEALHWYDTAIESLPDYASWFSKGITLANRG
jgi:hypothetical protein